jgi:hypothetical protein
MVGRAYIVACLSFSSQQPAMQGFAAKEFWLSPNQKVDMKEQ